MCGLVGAVSHRDVVPSLLEGLRRLEYRGYDSAGVAAINGRGLISEKAVGRVDMLVERLSRHHLSGSIGIGHTRWATHGKPDEGNAHPQLSGNEIAVVHNGIIENHEALRRDLEGSGYTFASETDTEVIAHLIHRYCRDNPSLKDAVLRATQRLEGTFAIAAITSRQRDRIVAARRGSPLLIGVGDREHYLASDVIALAPVTQYFIALEEGDVAEITPDCVNIVDQDGQVVVREMHKTRYSATDTDKGHYPHYMLKEIFQQDAVLERTLQPALDGEQVRESVISGAVGDVLEQVEHIHIVACGTSFHAGLVASYTIESMCGISCKVELASEFRYRRAVVNDKTLFVTLSQSGETADTLAALRFAKRSGYLATLSICNVDGSSLVRESDMVFLTHAGPEIGVASTKAFTTQLVNLYLLAILIARYRGLSRRREASLVGLLRRLPARVESVYELDRQLRELAEEFVDQQHTLFLGRGQMYPIAMEGALKLKEISYIDANAYAAGELKHGPLALVDASMPIIALAPYNPLLAKLKSNLEEVRARGGRLLIFGDQGAGLSPGKRETVIRMPKTEGLLAPIIYTVPLQLLAYHVAVLRGANVDQPRNLAKSVTVE